MHSIGDPQSAYNRLMQLAQLNIGRLVDDPDSDAVAEFMNAIAAINLLGESSPGFVWMLKDDEGVGATGLRYPGHEDDEQFIVNLTVWDDFDAMRHFVTRSGHGISSAPPGMVREVTGSHHGAVVGPR